MKKSIFDWVRLPSSLTMLVLVLCFYTAQESIHAEELLSEPRIPPLKPEELNEEQRLLLQPLVESGRDKNNLYTTMAQHPELAKAWLGFGAYIQQDNSLPLRAREILILRVGALCNSEYEWAKHRLWGKKAGLTEAEIVRIFEGSNAEGWSTADQNLMRAAEELHDSMFISDVTWNALADIYSQKQMMDLVFTIGQYHMLAMALNSFGVQLEEGLVGFPHK